MVIYLYENLSKSPPGDLLIKHILFISNICTYVRLLCCAVTLAVGVVAVWSRGVESVGYILKFMFS